MEILATNAVRDLRRREADIAIRAVRPTDPDLIARKLMIDTAELYASEAYLRRVGELSSPEKLSCAEFVGFNENEPFLDGLNARGLTLSARNFPVLCGQHLVQWELVKHGAGVGVMISRVGDAEPLVRRAAPWFPPF